MRANCSRRANCTRLAYWTFMSEFKIRHINKENNCHWCVLRVVLYVVLNIPPGHTVSRKVNAQNTRMHIRNERTKNLYN